jgi:SAM-dependent methyltransferase
MTECVVCGSRNHNPIYPGIVKCEECSHVFADLRMTDAELLQLYSKSYFFGDEYSDYLADREVLRKNFQLRLKTLEPHLTPHHPHRLLEIGSAYGFFLELVRDRFDAVGIDITADGTRYAKEALGLDVVHGDFLTYDFGDRRFNVVCLWDTIEHLRDPHLYMEKVSRHTKPGALLAITTGDAESLVARTKKAKWRLIHPPTHLHYFSRTSLGRLLNRCSFDVISSRHCGFYRSVDNIAYNILVLRKKRERLYHLLKRCGLTGWHCYLNLYDIMYVIARRREGSPA